MLARLLCALFDSKKMPFKRQYFPEMVIFTFTQAVSGVRMETDRFYVPFISG
jgi:hypothetical protein